MKRFSPISVVCVAVLTALPAFADPPSHAPAWGYRDKHEKHDNDGDRTDKHHGHRGYTGTEWDDDYGVGSGRCNTDAILTAVGAVGGAAIGNRVASRENRVVATIVGAVIGGLIGNKVGDAIDDGDRGCLGHALEIAPVRRAVVWTNSRTHVEHYMRPVRDLDGGCREFEYREGPRGRLTMLTACRADGGAWRIRR
ncbi:MAG: glycine zipper 2TM domain-containing protein [Steroidobacteraceae bacterium]